MIDLKTDKVDRILFFIRFTPKQLLSETGFFSFRNNTIDTLGDRSCNENTDNEVSENKILIINNNLDCLYFKLNSDDNLMIILMIILMQ